MASKVQIANRALRQLGTAPIQSLVEATEAGRLVNEVFDLILEEVLAKHPWNCALVRTTLAADAAAPAWGFARSFTLPADPYALRVWRLSEDAHPNAKWRVIGRKIHSDEAAPLRIEYIARVADPEQLPPYVAVAVAAAIAEAIAYRLTNSREKEKQMGEWAKDALREARSADAQEGTPEEPIVDEFLSGRH